MAPTVTTRSGNVRGFTQDKALVFLGVPYAVAPVGEHRFGPPQPPQRWNGTKDALAYGATALQPPPGVAIIPEPLVEGDNCLNLNIFTPELGDARLPVIVWIHGGGFFAGCNASPWYAGQHFARDGVILVSINYRLGIEGFLPVDDGGVNRGVLDWLSALAWVQDNITAFGGDENNVTIAGQSAGGIVCATLLSMPRAQGLFRRAISMSGPVEITNTLARSQVLAEQVAADLGVKSTRHDLAAVPVDRLLQAQAALMPAGLSDNASPDPGALTNAFALRLPLTPVVDDDVIPFSPLDGIREGVGSDIDLLVGTTAEELNVTFRAMGDKVSDNNVTQTLGDLGLTPDRIATYRNARPDLSGGAFLGQAITDYVFRVPTTRLAEARAQAAARTYTYEFRWASPAMGGVLGSGHCLDIPFAFDNLDAEGIDRVAGPDAPNQLSRAMHRAWVQFATTGDPGWPTYDLDRRATMTFNSDSKVVNDPLQVERGIW